MFSEHTQKRVDMLELENNRLRKKLRKNDLAIIMGTVVVLFILVSVAIFGGALNGVEEQREYHICNDTCVARSSFVADFRTERLCRCGDGYSQYSYRVRWWE